MTKKDIKTLDLLLTRETQIRGTESEGRKEMLASAGLRVNTGFTSTLLRW